MPRHVTCTRPGAAKEAARGGARRVWRQPWASVNRHIRTTHLPWMPVTIQSWLGGCPLASVSPDAPPTACSAPCLHHRLQKGR